MLELALFEYYLVGLLEACFHFMVVFSQPINSFRRERWEKASSSEGTPCPGHAERLAIQIKDDIKLATPGHLDAAADHVAVIESTLSAVLFIENGALWSVGVVELSPEMAECPRVRVTAEVSSVVTPTPLIAPPDRNDVGHWRKFGVCRLRQFDLVIIFAFSGERTDRADIDSHAVAF